MTRYKYPHTPHLPWSPGVNSDDSIISEEDVKELFSVDLVITEKIDGENTTLYRDHIHARSIDSKDHSSRQWVKKMWGDIKHDIPEGWRICGENVYARHSIFYRELPSYFLGFSIWNEYNMCINWRETLDWFHLLGIKPVPTLWTGNFDHCVPSEYELITPELFKLVNHEMEGYVVRTKDYNFHYEDFDKNVAKYVRANHVQTSEHWMNQPVVKNGLE